MKKIIGNPSLKNSELIKIIKETKINNYYVKNKADFRDLIIKNILNDDCVLDIGKAMREKFIDIKCEKLETDNSRTSLTIVEQRSLDGDSVHSTIAE